MPTLHKQVLNSLLNTLLKRKLRLERLELQAQLVLEQLELQAQLAPVDLEQLAQRGYKAHRGQLQQLERRVRRVRERRAARVQLAHKEPRDWEHKELQDQLALLEQLGQVVLGQQEPRD
jgi:hypothetical protein